MNGIDFFVDTNVLIYVLEEHKAVTGITQCALAVSVISEIELLGKKAISPHEVKVIRALLNDCEIVDFSNTIKEIAISLKQKYSLKTPDAIIAATAKSFNLPLVTADRGFEKIDMVDIVLLNLT